MKSIVFIICGFMLVQVLASCRRIHAVLHPAANIEFLTPTLYDFGEHDTIDSVYYTLIYKNVGDVPFVINQVETNCGCTTARYSKEPLTPGQTDSIRIALQTQHLLITYLHKTITIYSNADSAYHVVVKGKLK